VLAYAVPASALEPLLPETLEPNRHGDLGFVAAAFVQTERMRPSSLPAALGLNFFLGGYRIFVRVAGRPSLRGLYILRSDTDRRLLTFFGNLFTSYRYRTVEARCRLQDETLSIVVDPGVRVSADLSVKPGPLPANSPFVRELSFFSPERFGAEPVLANAFYVGGIDYRWRRGELLPPALR
jgi:Uncharacterized conserved protein (COG2071)